MPDDEQHSEWFGPNRYPMGVGYLTGAISGGITMFEAENRDDLDKLKADAISAGETGVAATIDKIFAGYSDLTPGGGIHGLYFCPVTYGNTVLAKRPIGTDPKTGRTLYKPVYESRGEGGFTVAAPSWGNVHKTLKPYVMDAGAIETIATITPEEQDALFAFCRRYDEGPKAKQESMEPEIERALGTKPNGEGKGSTRKEGDPLRPGDDFNERVDWGVVLRPDGWVLDHTDSSGESYWRRPGKDFGHSATTNYNGSGLLIVFTSSSIFDETKTYSKFGAYAALHHGGDHTAAARDLGKQGYGDQSKRRKTAPISVVFSSPGEAVNPVGFGGNGQAESANGQAVGKKDKPKKLTLENYEWEFKEPAEDEVGEDGKAAKGKWVKVPATAREIDIKFRQAMDSRPNVLAGCGTLFVEGRDHQPVMLGDKDKLLAWVDGRSVIVDWTKGQQYITQARYYEHLRMTGIKYEAIETQPHWPEIPGHYYMHEAVPKSSKGKHLDAFLSFFSPMTAFDRQLMKACIASFFWGGGYGTRPAWFITSPAGDLKKGRGVGKSTFAALVAELSGGYLDLQAGETISDATPRILSDGAAPIRCVRLDNVKVTKYSDPDLEAFITKPKISGKRLYKGEGSRPNVLSVLLTMNGGSLSPDLSQRIITIILQRPIFQADWEERVRNYMKTNQWEIIADIGDFLSKATAPLTPKTRWAAWEAGVLSRVECPAECQSLILSRQESADGGSEENHLIAEYIQREIIYRYDGADPQECHLFIRQGDMARWVSKALRDKKTTAQSNNILQQLGGDIPQLSFSPTQRNGYPGYIWRGDRARPKHLPAILVNPNEDGDSDYCGTKATPVIRPDRCGGREDESSY